MNEIRNFEDNSISTPLSRKVKNRIKEVFKVFCEEALVMEILDSVRLQDDDPLILSRVNRCLPQVLECFFGKNIVIRSIDLEDLKALIELFADKIAKEKSFEDVILSVGMGGSIDQPNVRSPAYILPAIKTVEALQELAKEGEIVGVPKIRVFKANHLSSKFNDFEIDRVQEVTGLTFTFLLAFVEQFFPHVKRCFIFDVDDPVTEDFLGELGKRADFLRTQSRIENEVNNILKMGAKHGGSVGVKNSLLYAGAHPFYNRSIVSRGDRRHPLIIDYGGKPQERFNRLSRVLIENVKSEIAYVSCPVVHVIIRPGKIPVYYSARDGDLPLDANFTGIDLSILDRSVRCDFAEIFSAVDANAFEAFVGDFIYQTFNKK